MEKNNVTNVIQAFEETVDGDKEIYVSVLLFKNRNAERPMCEFHFTCLKRDLSVFDSFHNNAVKLYCKSFNGVVYDVCDANVSEDKYDYGFYNKYGDTVVLISVIPD